METLVTEHRVAKGGRMTRAERREAILECATRQFARRGYQQTTLAQIAAEDESTGSKSLNGSDLRFI